LGFKTPRTLSFTLENRQFLLRKKTVSSLSIDFCIFSAIQWSGLHVSLRSG